MKSAGEDRLAAALEKALKPPWAIYRNVAWLEKRPGDEPADGEADLVLAHPDLGVMVIEVKGGRVQRIGGRWESVDGSGNGQPDQGPVRAGHAARCTGCGACARSCRPGRSVGCDSPARSACRTAPMTDP